MTGGYGAAHISSGSGIFGLRSQQVFGLTIGWGPYPRICLFLAGSGFGLLKCRWRKGFRVGSGSGSGHQVWKAERVQQLQLPGDLWGFALLGGIGVAVGAVPPSGLRRLGGPSPLAKAWRMKDAVGRIQKKWMGLGLVRELSKWSDSDDSMPGLQSASDTDSETSLSVMSSTSSLASSSSNLAPSSTWAVYHLRCQASTTRQPQAKSQVPSPTPSDVKYYPEDTPYQRRVESRFARYLTVFTRQFRFYSNLMFGDRRSPQNPSALCYILSAADFQHYFSEYGSHKELELLVAQQPTGETN
ncbi:hypothetical protein GALMADRAFT_146011 [Galerina marginata CBS 339.88]|uniref:Uncharacterized protein n=1 Tax=Galerina marginata (strain CBS 339.88) TaxID=685588 RepID=A0A067SF68_GALM3|nr:hypothetical protein GALMADRAFT_146011 [Galerina marginata CBS 339.88]